MQRSPKPKFDFCSESRKIDETSSEYQMEMAILTSDDDERYKRVEFLLKNGANPNNMTGQFKWIDTNPLWKIGENKKLVELFVKYGADVKRRPYIANVLCRKILAEKNPVKKWQHFHEEHPQVYIPKEEAVFASVKFLLENGADVNMKYTGTNKILFPATDWNYRHYFEKYGETAINYSIKTNCLTIFNLLLEYGATLDKESLMLAKETTEQTGSAEMEELVKMKWKLQNEK